MHNSQNGASMAYDGGSAPSDFLTRGGCVGCHAQNTPQKIITLDLSEIPQVSHTDVSGDLAGGNFAYILGTKGSGASDAKGHNVIDLGNPEDTLWAQPGGIVLPNHNEIRPMINAGNLTCAGTRGCHGYRIATKPSQLQALAGAHHNDVEGVCDTADNVESSYRFLLGVKGFENQTDKWQNISSASHNEYFGATSPPKLGCAGDGSTMSCHGADGIRPPTNTISGFCGTCHGNFHTLESGVSSGIGADILSPFIRHPNDIVLKASGEYAAYTTYDINVPVGRTTVPLVPSSTVTPGSDVVTCLSCHMAHASDYPDMLRWDYDGMMAHDSSAAAGTGCFVCHTTKDDY